MSSKSAIPPTLKLPCTSKDEYSRIIETHALMHLFSDFFFQMNFFTDYYVIETLSILNVIYLYKTNLYLIWFFQARL